MRSNIGFTRPVVQMNPMQFGPQHNINRQQTIIAQPRPMQTNQIISTTVGQRPTTMIYPNMATAASPSIPSGLFQNVIQQPVIQTPQPIIRSGFGILGPPQILSTVTNPIIQSNIPIQQPIEVSPTIPIPIQQTQTTSQIRTQVPFHNPFIQEDSVQQIVQIPIINPVVTQQTLLLNNQALKQPQILIINHSSTIQNNPETSFKQRQPNQTNNSLLRAQINQTQYNEWQPIETPKIYTFDYGFHS